MYTWNSVCIKKKTNCIFFFLLTLCKRTLCMWVVWELNGLILRASSVSCSCLVWSDIDFLFVATALQAALHCPKLGHMGKAGLCQAAFPGTLDDFCVGFFFCMNFVSLLLQAQRFSVSPGGESTVLSLPAKHLIPAAAGGLSGLPMVQCYARESQALPQALLFHQPPPP